MQHSLNVGGTVHTVTMDTQEALVLMAKLAEAVRLAVGPSKVASVIGNDMAVTIQKTGQRINGTLDIVVHA